MALRARSISCLLAIAVVACAAPAPSPSPSPTPTPTSTPTTTLPQGPASPSAAATPAEPAALVIRFTARGDADGANPGTTVLADGRAIWAIESTVGIILFERTLTPFGLQTVRDAVDATGVLAADGRYTATVKPGKVPPGHGLTGFTFRASNGASPVLVVTSDPTGFEPEFWDVPPVMFVLADLARKLADPLAWLPADAWAGDGHAYVAERYLLLVTAERLGGAVLPGLDVDSVSWPFASPIWQVGLPYVIGGQLVENGRCAPIDRATADQMAAAEAAVGVPRSLAQPDSDATYPWLRGPGLVNVRLHLLLPDQPFTCLDGGAW